MNSIFRQAWASLSFLLMLCAVPAQANHEHLASLPDWEDFRAMLGKDWESIPISALNEQWSDWASVLGRDGPVATLFGVGVRDRLIGRGGLRNGPISLRQFLGAINHLDPFAIDSVDETMRAMIESHLDTSDRDGITLAEKKNAYRMQEQLRARLLVRLSAGGNEKVVGVFEHYLRRTPGAFGEHGTLAICVPNGFARPALMQELRATFAKYGSEAKMYVSLPREIFKGGVGFAEREVAGRIESLKFMDGIDISGSMFEPNTPPVLTQTFLSRIFQAASAAGKEVRIHAFEAKNEGTFYDALWSALQSIPEHASITGNGIREIRIGHTGAITEADIEAFKRLPASVRRKLIFECNPASSSELHGIPYETLASTALKLHEAGFRVVLGMDGRGLHGPNFGNLLTSLGLAMIREAPGDPATVRSAMAAIVDDTLHTSRQFDLGMRERGGRDWADRRREEADRIKKNLILSSFLCDGFSERLQGLKR